jgi:hypothetical protein
VLLSELFLISVMQDKTIFAIVFADAIFRPGP